MVKVLAAAGCVLVLTACASSAPAPVTSQTPTNDAAQSPAATLRVHLDLLLGEHVFAIAKLAEAAGAGRQDEYHSYASMLAGNGGDVEALFRTALGETSGGRFGAAWTEQNNFLVDYVVAAVTQDQAGAATAASKLSGTAVPDIAAALVSGIALNNSDAMKVAAGHVTLLMAIVDDVAAGNYAQLYTAIVGARMQAVTFGDAVAFQVARQFGDRFPGDPAGKAAGFRANLNSLMQQQGYLLTMATDATAAAAAADAAAARTTLDANSGALATMYGGDVWTSESELITAYAKKGDAASRQSVIGAAPAALSPPLTALLQVVDDQRNKQFAGVAADDRSMAAAFATVADEVSSTS